MIEWTDEANWRVYTPGTDTTGPYLVGHVYLGGAGGLARDRRVPISVRTVPLDRTASFRVRFVVEYLHSAM
jgi:hypothetical protein